MKVSIRPDHCIALRMIAAQEHYRKSEDWLNMVPEWERLVEVASQSQAIIKMQVAENARLRAENEKLRAALKRLHDAATDIGDDEMSYSIREWWNNETDAAKAALGESDE